jgi:hypothetical protein
MYTRDPRDHLSDVRDGLTSCERIVLQCLHALQQEHGGAMFLQECCMAVWLSMWI